MLRSHHHYDLRVFVKLSLVGCLLLNKRMQMIMMMRSQHRHAIYYNNDNNNIYLLQLGCYPVAVVILHVNKHEIGY